MIKGIGIDLVSISSFSKKLENKSFLEITFTPNEIRYCMQYKKASERFAGKFAAKEAFMKALGKGIRQEIWFLQIEVLNNEVGVPSLKLSGNAASACEEQDIGRIHLSISHTEDNAAAIVILESNSI